MMLTWQQIKDALDPILKPDERIAAIHIAAGKIQLEIVRGAEETIIRTPVMPKEQKT